MGKSRPSEPLLPPEWRRSPEWFLQLNYEQRQEIILVLEALVQWLKQIDRDESVVLRDLGKMSTTPPEEGDVR
jgi:hypothetical protein